MDIWVKEEERHVQVNDLRAESMEEYRGFWRGLCEKYAGFSVDFCYHTREIPHAFLLETGASLLESCRETRLMRESFTPACGVEATQVTAGNLAAFAAIHDRANPEMYWTGERISRDLSRWRIYMHDDAYVMMSLWGDIPEIFALEAATAKEGAALLSAAAAFAFETGKTGVLMMVDDGAPVQAEAARAVGFQECGSYAAYRGVVK